jgi:hypothetical protein
MSDALLNLCLSLFMANRILGCLPFIHFSWSICIEISMILSLLVDYYAPTTSHSAESRTTNLTQVNQAEYSLQFILIFL